MDLLMWHQLSTRLTSDGTCILAPVVVYRYGKRFQSRQIAWELFGTGQNEGFLVASCRKRRCITPGHISTSRYPTKHAKVGQKPKPKPPKPPRVVLTPEEREERRRTQRRAWQTKNADKLRSARLERYWSDPERFRAKAREYKANNPQRISYAHQVLNSPKADEIKLKRASNNQVRRARLRGGRYDNISLQQLIERDEAVCHLCGSGPSEDPWSMDHLQPVSKGGEHVWENVKLAHRLCNVRRGVKPLL